jgi:excinuclease ABC subunit A
VAANPESFTGQFLAPILEGRAAVTRRRRLHAVDGTGSSTNGGTNGRATGKAGAKALTATPSAVKTAPAAKTASAVKGAAAVKGAGATAGTNGRTPRAATADPDTAAAAAKARRKAARLV